MSPLLFSVPVFWARDATSAWSDGGLGLSVSVERVKVMLS